jgi:probable rRNA maturation factor
MKGNLKIPAKVGTPRGRSRKSVEIATEGVSRPRGATRLAAFCLTVLGEVGFSAQRVGILLCDDARITALNARYRHLDEPTDVLSFPEEEAKKASPVSGDIAISLDALRRNAAAFRVSENEEMKRLLVHGLLHLAGMDHGTGRGGKMLALQERLLDTFHAEKIFGEKRK